MPDMVRALARATLWYFATQHCGREPTENAMPLVLEANILAMSVRVWSAARLLAGS